MLRILESTQTNRPGTVTDNSDFLSVRQAAEIKGCSRQTIYNAIERGDLNGAKVGTYHVVQQDGAFQAFEVSRKHDPRRNPLKKDEE